MTGRVVLVGAGPGDPGLLTLRGRDALADADLVLVDRLVSPEIVAMVRPGAEIVDVGKTPYGPAARQSDIDGLLVAGALAGRTVVRLKGGDPFLFGRGGEEALACAAAGVPCVVVPGVTSALAGPAAAGVPVTHRGLAQSVTVVSGHLPPGHPDSTVDWSAVAAVGGTVVVMMGVTHLAKICLTLVEHGRPGDTPVAVVQSATTRLQRTVSTTLDTAAADVERAGVVAPAVVVVGEVAALAGSLSPAPGSP